MAATIRKRTTGKLDKSGNPVLSYQVRWREPVRDEFGAPTGAFRQTSETFDTERKAKAHARKVDNELDSARGVDPSAAKAKASRPLGLYARQYLDSLVGSIDPTTIQGYEKIYRVHIAPTFGNRPVASITTAEIDAFRATLLAPHERSFVTRGKPSASTKPRTVHRSPKTVRHIIGTLKRILDTALRDQAIASNPVVAARRTTTKRRTTAGKQAFKHRPLTSSEVAALYDWIASERGNGVYALAVVFSAYTGVRASELQGLQVADVTLSDIAGTAGAVRIARTAAKQDGKWNSGTPKTAKSDRVVPLAPWLADDLREYLTHGHPFAGKLRDGEGKQRYIAHAPLFPGRRNSRGGTTSGATENFDWAHPVVVDNVYHNYFQPACKALGLGNVRWHDLRHTFATLALSAGEHYMSVSKWLGHSTFVLTLSTYADYIREDETAPPAFARPVAEAADNVTTLKRRRQA